MTTVDNVDAEWAFIEACCKGDETTVFDMIANGVNVNSHCFTSNYTPLHGAVISKNHSILQHLLAAGANVNVGCRFGATPLHFAVSRNYGDAQIARLLLEAGADTMALAGESEPFQTPRDYAILSGNQDFISLFQ